MNAPLCACLFAACTFVNVACDRASDQTTDAPIRAEAPVDIPNPDTNDMEPAVRARIAEARSAVAAAPASDNAWGTLAKVLHAHRLYADAVTCYRRAAGIASAEFRWAYFGARASELAGADPETVLSAYAAAIGLRHDYAPAHVRWADAKGRAGRLDDAIDSYREALRLEPDNARAHRGLGQILLMQGAVDEAIEHLEQAAQRTPDDGAVYAALARAYARAGRDADAEAATQRAESLPEEHAMADAIMQEVTREGVSLNMRMMRVRELRHADRFAEAITELEQAAADQPDNALIQSQLGSIYLSTDDVARAKSSFERAIAIDDTMVAAQAGLGGILLQLGEPDAALVHLSRAAQLGPTDAATACSHAAALAQTGRLDDALAEFERAAGIGELDAAAQNNWGSTLRAAGRIEPAIEHYRQALRIDPDHVGARYNLGLSLEKTGDLAAAREQYEHIIRIDPSHPAGKRLESLGE